jgi:hypothetical protein
MVSSSELQALISLMDRHYQEIRALEAAHDIFGAEGDFRPRIEYYHDAVRALSSGENNPYSKYDRLAPERIAYDVSLLRQIQDKPLHAGRGSQHYSTSAEVSVGQGVGASRPPREIRVELSKLYKDYTVMFVALLAEKMDDTVQIRTEESEVLAGECADMAGMIAALEQGTASVQEVLHAADRLEHDDLRMLLTQLLSNGKPESKQLKALIAKLKEMQGKMQEDGKAVSQASLNFATAQLAVYEEARETVKRFAAQGLNLAGKFVENAVSQSQGRGSGRGV